MENKFFEVSGGKICYQIRKGKEKTLVFLHGGGGSISSWKLIRPYFEATNYTLLYIDLPGHGRSFRPKSWQDYKIERQAQDIIRVIGLLRQTQGRGEKVILIGHCLGALVAATFTALYPEKVEKLILVNPGEKRSFFLFSAIKPIITLLLNKIYKSDTINTTNTKRVDYKKFVGSADLSPRRLWADLKAMGFYPALCQAKAFFAWEGEKYFPKIKAETLIIAGKRDIIFPPRASEKVARTIKRARLEMIESNHISVINNPKEVWEKILEFLKD